MITSLLLLPIRLYQRFVSPALAPHCRFAPSCSHYAVAALQTHGPLRGSWLALRRVLRCHPWNPGGHDPVPPTRSGSATIDLTTEPVPPLNLEPRSRAGATP